MVRQFHPPHVIRKTDALVLPTEHLDAGDAIELDLVDLIEDTEADDFNVEIKQAIVLAIHLMENEDTDVNVLRFKFFEESQGVTPGDSLDGSELEKTGYTLPEGQTIYVLATGRYLVLYGEEPSQYPRVTRIW